MLVELGNHARHRAIDEHPAVTTIHIPDADEHGTGGYTHEHGITVAEFREHYLDALLNRGGITRLPGHEALLSVVKAWTEHAHEAPAWVHVSAHDHHEHLPKKLLAERRANAKSVQEFLREFYKCPGTERPPDVEDRYHTRYGPPGVGGPVLPDARALFTNAGRVQQAVNYGGGQVGATGQATASSATTLTTASTYTLNQWAGYRVYATVSGSAMVWGNVISNTAGANSVLTVDRWYTPSSPGGSAGSTPSSTAAFVIPDGGSVSAWFVALSTTNIIPAAADTALSGEYTAAGGGLVRKIAPYSLTSGTAPMSLTLTPVYTANGSDTLPSTFYAVGAFTSMVVADTTLAMKFESSLNASQTLSAVSDQLTVTWTESGS